MKQYMLKAPLLSTPREGDKLHLYLVVSKLATSAVMVRKKTGIQHLVYYINKTLLDAETRYPRMEKWALALVMVAQKLRPYFQAYLIIVTNDHPLRQVLHKLEVSGHLVK